MDPITALPFIPENIVVHLGRPNQDAQNVTVPFPEYIKNVASSEIYPTWPENAIRANIYAIITFALNRIYTEWYRSRGYDFDITNSTQYDQAFQYGRDIFENISEIVDEIFNNYVRKQGSVAPYFTQFCNGTTVTCDGLSQWGTVELANQGLTPLEILQYYYGDDIEIVQNAPIRSGIESYPGTPLEVGDAGNEIKTIQVQLNRISNNYPAIPKINPSNGIFGEQTAAAVRTFQGIFNLPQTGIVDKSTWYKIKYIYNSVKRLGELAAEGLSLEEVLPPYPSILRLGSTGPGVQVLQYYLDVIGYFNPALDIIAIDGIFGPNTEKAVRDFQQEYGLTVDGIMGRDTWNKLQEVYEGIISSLPEGYQGEKAKVYPGYYLTEGARGQDVTDLQTYLALIGRTYTTIPEIQIDGIWGPATTAAVRAFQQEFGLPVTGAVGPITWNLIAQEYDQISMSPNA